MSVSEGEEKVRYAKGFEVDGSREAMIEALDN